MGDSLFNSFKAQEEIRREAGAMPPGEFSQTHAKGNHEPKQRVDPAFATVAGFADPKRAPSPAPARKKEERKDYIITGCNYAREAATPPVSSMGAQEEPAKVAKAGKFSLSYSDHKNFSRFGVAKIFGGDLWEWQIRHKGRSPDRDPCSGYRGSDCPTTLARALAFLVTIGNQALVLGWTAPRIFGVHPVAGVVRVNVCGALVLPGGGADRAITATEVAFGHLTYRIKPGQPEGVPIWAVMEILKGGTCA